jgi:hypothetical protein
MRVALTVRELRDLLAEYDAEMSVGVQLGEQIVAVVAVTRWGIPAAVLSVDHDAGL